MSATWGPRVCEGDSDDCTGLATTSIDGRDWYRQTPVCEACKAAYDRWLDNYDGPPDADGEDIFRDYQAEARDSMDAARRLK